MQLSLRVWDDGEGEVILALERSGIALCRHSDDLGVELSKVLRGVSEGAALARAAGPGSVGEVEHDVARAAEAGERDLLAVPVGLLKVGGLASFGDHSDDGAGGRVRVWEGASALLGEGVASDREADGARREKRGAGEEGRDDEGGGHGGIKVSGGGGWTCCPYRDRE